MLNRSRKYLVATAVVLAGLSVGAAKCGGGSDLSEAKQKQQTVMQKATAAVPAYVPSKFSGREDINWSIKETEGRHTWYVYALAMDGKPLFYVVSDMKPRNKCISITAPDRVYSNNAGTVKLSAPSMLGTYFGGAGNCQTYYLRDAQTGSYIELNGGAFTLIATKAPLSIETDRLLFTEKEENSPAVVE